MLRLRIVGIGRFMNARCHTFRTHPVKAALAVCGLRINLVEAMAKRAKRRGLCARLSL
jgi:hypothetical protein